MTPSSPDVNILIHGLFFMTYNPTTDNLEILAPKITDHLFVGGIRGSRVQLPSSPVILTNAGLKAGTPHFPGGNKRKIPNEIKGTILQFTRDETGVGDFSGATNFVGKIILPWPEEFHSIRCDDRAKTFKADPSSVVGQRIEDNCNGKGKSKAGVVTCLRYKVVDPKALPWPSGANPHFYLQPCMDHDSNAVNADLAEVKQCFVNPTSFDLQLIPLPTIPRTPIGKNKCQDNPAGLTPDDELSLDEENDNGAPDIRSICANSKPISAEDGDEEPAVSPANCPTFYVG